MLTTYHNNLKMLGSEICSFDISVLTKSYRDYCKKLQRNHGKAFMVNRMKAINTMCERYALYQPFEPLSFTKSDNDGFIKVFSNWKQYLRSNKRNDVVLTLSVFRSCECYRLPPHHELASVIDASTADDELLRSIINYIPTFVNNNNLKLKLGEMKYHYTVRKGPNGFALTTSDSDLDAIIKDNDIWQAVQLVSKRLEDEFPPEDTFHRKEGGIHSKLTQFSEKSGKTRTIAVVDYYSQRALKPLHNGLMKLLSSIKSDGTSSHKNVGNYAKQRTKDKLFIQSFDLTAFTDRFPAKLQAALLESLISDSELCTAFWTLLSKRTFTVSWDRNREVTYGAGQPMGAYASWPLCTLAHHLLIQYCFNAKAQNQYRIIGDDVVIASSEVAELYQKNIKLLGVECNPGKGTKSELGQKWSGTEVAKQLYLNGIEVSPLTPGLMKGFSNPYLVNSNLQVLLERLDEPALPFQFINKFICKSKQNLAMILCTNPFNGCLSPEGLQTDINWSVLPPGALTETLKLVRMKTQTDKAMKLYVDSMPTGTYLASWASLNAGYLDVQYFTGGGWKLATTRPEAQVLSRRYLLKAMFESLECISNALYHQGTLDEAILQSVEYVPNPDDPFLDQKVLRRTRMSSLIEQTYSLISRDGFDLDDLRDEIEIPPYVST